MKQNIAIIGSDINGAMGSASQFANCGADVKLFLGNSIPRICDVAVITANSKHATAKRAYSKTRDAIRKCHGRRIYMQEASSLKGNLPSSIRAVIDELNPRKILVCLSSPEKGRHVQNGIVHVEGVPADQTAVTKDPLSPVKEAHIPTLIYKSIGIKSRVLGFNVINRGPEAILRHIMNSSERIVILDALEPQHFRNIAGAIKLGDDNCFTCLTNVLSRELPFIHGYSRERLTIIEPLCNKKPVLVVIGSYEPIAGIQLHRARKKTGLPVFSLDTTGLLSLKRREGRIEEYCEKVIDTLQTDSNVAITSGSSKFIPQLRYKMAYLLAEIAARALSSCDVGALLTSGADTTYAICDTLRVQGIDVLGSIRKNVSTIILKLHLTDEKSLYIGSRGGEVGGPDDIQETLKILRPAIL